MFDRSGKGSIDIEAFARLHQFLMQMQESFRYFDQERRGSLSYNAVHQALQHAGLIPGGRMWLFGLICRDVH